MTTDTIRGKAYVLPDNVDTDQILTAEFLKINPSTPEGYQQLGRLAMCGLPAGYPPFIDEATGRSPYSVIVGGQNFGCGSSREHAVVALGVAGIRAVLAPSFARIFFRNCVVTGEVLPLTTATRLADCVETGDEVEICLATNTVTLLAKGVRTALEPVGELAAIVDAGGLFAYARATGRMSSAAAS